MQKIIIKPFISIFLLIIIGTFQTVARHLTPEEVLTRYKQSENNLKTRSTDNYTLINKIEDENSKLPNLYIFSNTEGEKVILSASDKTPVLLGYFDGDQMSDTMPMVVKKWLQEYSNQIEFLESNGNNDTFSLKSTTGSQPINKLLTTKWDQYFPYNAHCPEVNGKNCLTGCVATAFAQVMNYHKWPKNGKGEKTYYDWKNNNTLSINFSEIEFDWDNLIDIYDVNSPEESINAVAELMKSTGYSVGTAYGLSSSTSAIFSIPYAAENYFSYSDKILYLTRDYFPAAKWEEIILDQLNKGLPVIYQGRNQMGSITDAHCFVCDGFDGKGYYHFNWGWGGRYDGFFLLSAISPGGEGIFDHNYNYEQSCLINLYPESSTYEDMIICRGNSFKCIETDNSFYLQSYYGITNESIPNLKFGVQLYSEEKNEYDFIELKENETNETMLSFEFNISKFKELAMNEGKYITKFVFSTGEKWQEIAYSFSDPSFAIIDYNGNELSVEIPKSQTSISITDIKFNNGSILYKGYSNLMSYTINVNNLNERLFTDGNIYLSPIENPEERFLLRTLHHIFNSDCTTDFSDQIPDGQIESIPNGEYCLRISLKSNLTPELKDEEIFKNINNICIRDLSIDELVSDGTFTFMPPADNKVILHSLAATSKKLEGEVILPSKTIIDGKEFDIMHIYCMLRDLMEDNKVSTLAITTPIKRIRPTEFKDFHNLKSIDLPLSLQNIEFSAFENCESLESLTLPEGVEEVPLRLAADCKSLQIIKLPSTLSIIKNGAFMGAPLTKIVCMATQPPSLILEPFDEKIYDSAVLYVNEESLELYRTHEGWKNFKNILSLDDFNMESDPLKSIEIVPSDIMLKIGETIQLNIVEDSVKELVRTQEGMDCPTLIWQSFEPNIATVSESGLVTAVSAGNTIISATYGEAYAECEVTVIEDAGVESLLANPDAKISIYTTDGILIGKDFKVEDLKTLSKGIYIIVCGKERFKISI